MDPIVDNRKQLAYTIINFADDILLSQGECLGFVSKSGKFPESKDTSNLGLYLEATATPEGFKNRILVETNRPVQFLPKRGRVNLDSIQKQPRRYSIEHLSRVLTALGRLNSETIEAEPMQDILEGATGPSFSRD